MCALIIAVVLHCSVSTSHLFKLWAHTVDKLLRARNHVFLSVRLRSVCPVGIRSTRSTVHTKISRFRCTVIIVISAQYDGKSYKSAECIIISKLGLVLLVVLILRFSDLLTNRRRALGSDYNRHRQTRSCAFFPPGQWKWCRKWSARCA